MKMLRVLNWNIELDTCTEGFNAFLGSDFSLKALLLLLNECNLLTFRASTEKALHRFRIKLASLYRNVHILILAEKFLDWFQFCLGPSL